MYQSSLFVEAQPIVAAKRPYVGSVIYETKGRAREYRELACNLYSGCDHRCVYCYAPDVLQRERKVFDNPQPRSDILRQLSKDALGYGQSGESRQVLFCFACDPYQAIDEKYALTRSAIEICHRSGLHVSTLTKGGHRALRDIDLFTPEDSFASTLTLLDDAASLEWEPGASLPQDRMDTLREFHDRDIPTWVSLEPVIYPQVTLDIIERTHTFVDEFKVGILNYHERAKQINWRKFAHDVRSFLEALHCTYYLKEDLRRYL